MKFIDPIKLTVLRKLLYAALLPAVVVCGLQTARAADGPQTEDKQANAIQEPSNVEALRIIDRPNRLAEERAAWNPTPIPLEEFLQPKIPLKERYPSTDVDLPAGWEIGGLARWMDNRYLLVTLSNPDIHPAKQRGISSRESRAPINERIYVLDSDTGNTYFLKTGRLECYWANQIVYLTGTYDGQSDNSPYKNETYKWIGPLGQETRYPFWESEKNTTKHSELTCQKTDVWEGKNIDSEKFQFTERLFPAHGYLAMDKKLFLEKKRLVETYPVWKQASDFSRFKGIEWHKSDGSKVNYPDLNFYDEVGWPIPPESWAPFIGRYVFGNGRSVIKDYQNYPYKPFKTVTLFSPTDGSVYKMIHKRELDLLKTNPPHATRAGLLWYVPFRTDAARQTNETGIVGIRSGPGLFLSQGEKFKQIAGIGATVVSPDGCRLFRAEKQSRKFGEGVWHTWPPGCLHYRFLQRELSHGQQSGNYSALNRPNRCTNDGWLDETPEAGEP